jgi:molybdate transport system substrate-binding protein
MHNILFITILLVCVNVVSVVNAKEPLYLGVASSFKPAATALISAFGQQTNSNIKLSSASSGKLFSQALNGAPFDMLLFADSKHSLLAEKLGIAVAASNFSYAIGEVALISRGERCLSANSHQFAGASLAIANPKIAPYGLAAKQVISNTGLDQIANLRLITAENAAQTLHFFASKNVNHIITSSALIQQWLTDNPYQQVSYCRLSPNSYDAISHQGIVLQQSKNQQAAAAFKRFILSQPGQTIISTLGYKAVSE